MSSDLKALIAEVAAEPSPAGWDGCDWFQVSNAEYAVFEIEPEKVPLMVAAWGAYEAFHDVTQGAEWDMKHQPVIEAAKAARPDLAAQPYWDRSSWTKFAVAFSDLTMRDAWKWWLKHQAWLGRNGVMEFADGS